jgi:hypothetical protein
MTFHEEAQSYLSTRGVLAETAAQFRVEVVAAPSHGQLYSWLWSLDICRGVTALQLDNMALQAAAV